MHPNIKKQPGVEHRIGSLVITRVYVLHAWLALNDLFSVSNMVSQRRNSFFSLVSRFFDEPENNII